MDSSSDINFSPTIEDGLWILFKENVAPRVSSNSLDLTDINILELGPGEKSIFENRDWNLFYGRPNSIVALDKNVAKIVALPGELPPLPNDFLNYVQGDITEKIPGGEYQLIFDSHCIHCLIDAEDRAKAWKNIFNALRPGGRVAGEMMVAHKFMQFNPPFFYAEAERILYKIVGETLRPLRKILSHLEVEQEILSAGFEIEYFFFAKGRKFSFDPAYEYAWKTDPDCLLWIAKKPSVVICSRTHPN